MTLSYWIHMQTLETNLLERSGYPWAPNMELNINAPLRVQTQQYFSLKHNIFKEAEEWSP